MLVEVAMRGAGGQVNYLRGLERCISSRTALEKSFGEDEGMTVDAGGEGRTVAKTLTVFVWRGGIRLQVRCKALQI